MNRWLLAALGISVLATTACGKKVKLEDLDEELAEVTCQKIFECCSQDEIEASANLFTEFSTEDECVSAYDSLLGLFFTPALKSAVDNGRAEYDAKAAGDCLAEYDSVSCEEVASESGDIACAEIIIPLVEDGGACEQDFECIGGSCATTSSDEGKCQTLPKEGEACLETEMDDFTFTTCADGLTCIADKCEAPKAEGADCQNGGECESGMCDFETMKCAGLKADGEDCFFGGECESGTCDEETSKCTAAGAPAGEGCGLL